MAQDNPNPQAQRRYEVPPDARVVVSPNGTGEIVNVRLGVRQNLTAQEHSLVSMLQAGRSLDEIVSAQGIDGERLRRFCERLAGMGLLRPRSAGRGFLPDDVPKLAAGVTFQRMEKPGMVACFTPSSGRTHELREMDAIIAHSLDGTHTVVDIVEAARMRGLPATLPMMFSFLRELDAMGFIEHANVMPRMDDVDIDIPMVRGDDEPADPPPVGGSAPWQTSPKNSAPIDTVVEQKLDALRSLSIPGEAKEGGKGPWIAAVVVLLIVVGAGAAWQFGPWKKTLDAETGGGGTTAATPTATAAPRARNVITVSSEAPTGAPVIASGYIAARDPITLGVTVGGRVQQVFVENGNLVKKDQVLVQLDAGETLAALSLAKAKKRDAERILDRTKALHASQAATQSDLDRAIGQAEIARAESYVQLQRLEQSKIRSPIAKATILDVLVRPGEVLTPGGDASQGVVKLADLSRLVAEIDVPESEVFRLRLGQPAEISADSAAVRHKGEIREIAEEADRARGTVLVKVDLLVPDRSLRLGNSVKASFLPDGATRMYIPRASVRNGTAWVVDAESKATPRPVGTRPAGPDRLEVVSGLKDGERILAEAEPASSGNIQ